VVHERIYEKARGVIAWLGMNSKNGSDALGFLSQRLLRDKEMH